jgi:hypothetical protein
MKMDISLIISLVSIVVAVVIPVVTLVYTKKQVDILKQDSEKRNNFEKTSKIILQVIEIIKKYPKPISFKSLYTIQADKWKEMHDNPKGFDLTLEIKPEPFNLYIAYRNIKDMNKVFNSVPIVSSQHLIDALMECAEFSTILTMENGFRFEANPDILQNNYVNLYDLLAEIVEYYRAYKVLKENESIINSCDNTIIETFKELVDQMATLIFKSVSEKHVLHFGSSDKSDDILKRLSNEIIDLVAIAEMRNSLIILCGNKLFSVQRKLLDLAYQ